MSGGRCVVVVIAHDGHVVRGQWGCLGHAHAQFGHTSNYGMSSRAIPMLSSSVALGLPSSAASVAG